MSENTKIEWCDHTFNPWEGCQKVGPGCDHCYAETRNIRFNGGEAINWGPSAPRRRTSVANWRKPLHWQSDAEAFQFAFGRRQRVFCASLADVFDNQVPAQWRLDLFKLIRSTPSLDWLLLTKRIGNVERLISEAMDACRVHESENDSHLATWLFRWATGEAPPRNVWLGATITSQEEADRDIPKLLDVPARVRFLSMEPLLGPVDISRYMWPVHGWWKGPYNSYGEAKDAGAECGLKRQGLVWAGSRFVDWVIVGGESGPGARPINPDWARSLRDQCARAGVPFLFKQWGEWAPVEDHECPPGLRSNELVTFIETTPPDGVGDVHQYHGPAVARIGKKAAGRLLDGFEHNGFPESGGA